MSLISVIIPSYNRALYVSRAIYSAIIQDYPNKEIIIVDDHSSDLSKFAYELFKDKIRVIYHEENKGAAAARNTGIMAAKGEYIAFLDSDDYWLPQKLSIQIRYMLDTKAFVSQTQEYWIRRGRRVNPNKENQKRGGDLFGISLRRSYVSPSCVMIKREVFWKVGLFCEELEAAEDYELWLRIGSLYPIELIDKPLVVREMGKRPHLSQRPEGMEFWRIMALLRLTLSWHLPLEKKREVLRELSKKLKVYGKGAQKRGKIYMFRLISAMDKKLEGYLGQVGHG